MLDVTECSFSVIQFVGLPLVRYNREIALPRFMVRCSVVYLFLAPCSFYTDMMYIKLS